MLKKVSTIIEKHLIENETDETFFTINKEFKKLPKDTSLNLEHLKMVCNWKSPRAIKLIESNSSSFIEQASYSAFISKNEDEKIKFLTVLTGVKIPMASAILTLLNPKKYGVLDIRVWQLLYHCKEVNTNIKGTNFTIDNWIEYLSIVRRYAKEYSTTARLIEKTLFEYHKKNNNKPLYN